MKQFVTYFLTVSVLFCISVPKAAGNTIQTAITRQQNDNTVCTFSVKPFERIKITGPFVVTIMGGNLYSVKASGYSQDLDVIDVSTRNSTLLVQYTPVKKSEKQNVDHGVVTVKITLPILKKAEFFELTRFTIGGFDEMEYLELIASSLSKGFGELKAKNLKFKVDALSSLLVQGKSDRLKVFLQGKSTLQGYGLKVRTVDITIEDMCQVEISASETLNASADGMSNISYKGRPTIRMDSDKTSIIKAQFID